MIVYHYIWCPTRHKPILVVKVKVRCQQLIEDQCKELGWLILVLPIQPDHIHVLLRVWPKESAVDVGKRVESC